MHTCRWIPETGPGIEHLVLRRDGEAIVAEGAVVGDRFGDGFGAFYAIRCDTNWRVRHDLQVNAEGLVVRYPGLFRRAD